MLQPDFGHGTIRVYWVAVKELKLSYHIGETLLFTIYTHYGNLISVPQQQPSLGASRLCAL